MSLVSPALNSPLLKFIYSEKAKSFFYDVTNLCQKLLIIYELYEKKMKGNGTKSYQNAPLCGHQIAEQHNEENANGACDVICYFREACSRTNGQPRH